MEISKTFSIAGRKFNVEFVDILNGGNDYGSFNDLTGTIKIANKIKFGDELEIVPEGVIINTFWHELFHVFNYYYNNETSETLAQVFANFMAEYNQSKA